jgi:hypothetical protein
VLAIEFLVILAVMLPVVLEVTNLGLTAIGWPSVEWRLYLDAARNDPLGGGLLVTGMLATTLIPTLVHLLAGSVALLLPWFGGRWIVALAEAGTPSLWDRGRFAVLAGAAGLLPWTALCLAAITAYHAAGLWFGPLGAGLARLALMAGGWVS